MADVHLVGTNGQIDFTLDGLTFRRSKTGAEARGVAPLHEVEWAAVDRACVSTSSAGKPVLEIEVTDSPAAERRKHDPYALKLKRGQAQEAREFADLVNHEVATRRRWEAAAAEAAEGTASVAT